MTHARDCGTSLVETLMVLALMTTAASMGVPVVGESRDADRLRRACQWLAGEFRAARQAAIQTGGHASLIFHPRAGDWHLQRCQGDGDVCGDASMPITGWVAGVRIARDPAVPDPSGSYTSAAVTFQGGLASFSPLGTGSSGTVILRSDRGRQCAVRVAGVTGRVRTLTFDAGTRQWRP